MIITIKFEVKEWYLDYNTKLMDLIAKLGGSKVTITSKK